MPAVWPTAEELFGAQVDVPVANHHGDLNLDGLSHPVAYLQPWRELGAVEKHGAPIVPPRSETAILEVVLTAVVQGHIEQALGVDEPGLVGPVNVDRATRAVHHDPELPDAQVPAQVSVTVGDGTGNLVVAERVGLGQPWAANKQEARHLREVQGVEIDRPHSVGLYGANL